jgi:uncharacterized protein YkwD
MGHSYLFRSVVYVLVGLGGLLAVGAELKPQRPDPPIPAAVLDARPAKPPATKPELALVEKMNRERVRRGIKPLVINSKLMECARMRAKKTNEWNVHDGYSSDTRRYGYRCSALAENFAWEFRQNPPSEASDSWMQSPGHRAAMLNRGYNEVGVGYAPCRWRGQSGIGVIAIFGRR